MKSQLVFLLIPCLILTGIPASARSQEGPKTLGPKEKTALTALANPDLLGQKAGDGQVNLQGTNGTPKSVPGKWVMMDGKWVWVDSDHPLPANGPNANPANKGDDGITPGGAILITAGVILAVIGIFTIIALASYEGE